MSPAQRREARHLASRLWVRSDTTRGRWARVLDEAVRRRLVVHLDYVDRHGTRTEGRAPERDLTEVFGVPPDDAHPIRLDD